MNGDLILKIVARYPTTGKPTQIFARRDFPGMADLKITVKNLTERGKNIKIIYAGKIYPRNGMVVDAREKFKRAGEIMLYKQVQRFT